MRNYLPRIEVFFGRALTMSMPFGCPTDNPSLLLDVIIQQVRRRMITSASEQDEPGASSRTMPSIKEEIA